MADKTRSATASLSFALSGRFTLAFKCCFQTGTSSQTLKRGGLEDSSSNYKHSIERQLKDGRVARSLVETVVEACFSAIGVLHDKMQNAHSTYENAPSPLFIGVRCVSAVKKWVNSRPRPPRSADLQPGAQPTNRRINHHKTAAPSKPSPPFSISPTNRGKVIAVNQSNLPAV